MSLQTIYLQRCITNLEKGFELYSNSEDKTIEQHLFRSACVKEFEIITEHAAVLLRKIIAPFFASAKIADRFNYKNLFKEAAKHGIITI